MSHRQTVTAMLAVAGLAAAATAQPQVIFTEFFAATNQAPGENERVQEFVEITNIGSEPVDVSGWYITDDITSEAIAAGTILQPGEALVLYGTQSEVPDPLNVSGDRTSPTVFAAQWANAGPIKSDFQTPFDSMSNSPNLDNNEIYTLFDADNNIIDILNYDDVFPWPSDSPQGTSVVLLPEFTDPAVLSLIGVASAADANDNGLAWRRSDEVFNGAFKTDGVIESVAIYYDSAALSAQNEIVLVPSTDPNAVLLTPGGPGQAGGNTTSIGFFDAIADFNDCNGNTIDDDVEIFPRRPHRPRSERHPRPVRGQRLRRQRSERRLPDRRRPRQPRRRLRRHPRPLPDQ
jgi:hypothetical protein